VAVGNSETVIRHSDSKYSSAREIEEAVSDEERELIFSSVIENKNILYNNISNSKFSFTTIENEATNDKESASALSHTVMKDREESDSVFHYSINENQNRVHNKISNSKFSSTVIENEKATNNKNTCLNSSPTTIENEGATNDKESPPELSHTMMEDKETNDKNRDFPAEILTSPVFRSRKHKVLQLSTRQLWSPYEVPQPELYCSDEQLPCNP
jgi:hypothetical protein